ncbi:hypothetical protein, partial [Craterilacuibacter sp.]|uniref:hypothetical protein n=1 Tax=Craterilacuibacter sp. TaxID=2870909 RepID=UPI003F2B455C
PSTHTYRLFVLLKSSADPLVSFAASAEEAKYTHPAPMRQHLWQDISNITQNTLYLCQNAAF